MAALSKRDKDILLGPNYVDPPEPERKGQGGVIAIVLAALVAIGAVGGVVYYDRPATTTASHAVAATPAG